MWPHHGHDIANARLAETGCVGRAQVREHMLMW
jgi:hypothetical protein